MKYYLLFAQKDISCKQLPINDVFVLDVTKLVPFFSNLLRRCLPPSKWAIHCCWEFNWMLQKWQYKWSLISRRFVNKRHCTFVDNSATNKC